MFYFNDGHFTLITSSRGVEEGQFSILDASSKPIEEAEEETDEEEADFFTFGFLEASTEKGVSYISHVFGITG